MKFCIGREGAETTEEESGDDCCSSKSPFLEEA